MVKSDIHKHYNRLLAKGELITAEMIKNSYQGVEEDRKTLFEAFEYHNNQMKDLIGIDVVKATHTKFETVLKKLRAYVKKKYRRSD